MQSQVYVGNELIFKPRNLGFVQLKTRMWRVCVLSSRTF